MADDLYRAYVKPRMWVNGKARSNLGMPIVLEAIEKILPTLYMSLFGTGKEPFYLRLLDALRLKPHAQRLRFSLGLLNNPTLKKQCGVRLRLACNTGS